VIEVWTLAFRRALQDDEQMYMRRARSRLRAIFPKRSSSRRDSSFGLVWRSWPKADCRMP